ncbi:hypothetical protein NDU88_004996 [Pleurodeles waltl]|uniref:Uncharacterized protein n=1 Tax=Pleurodeles waltl TaxID=8319 RepID=A0AAV7MD98_PLEWA|nr:hypothetical protein NDU88_004996 [Pleurodeles waltl]
MELVVGPLSSDLVTHCEVEGCGMQRMGAELVGIGCADRGANRCTRSRVRAGAACAVSNDTLVVVERPGLK